MNLHTQKLQTNMALQPSINHLLPSSPPPNPPPFLRMPFNNPFNSTAALTILVISTAIFVSSFFSVYMRKCNNSSDLSADDFTLHGLEERRLEFCELRDVSFLCYRELDPAIFKSLPVFCYQYGDGAKNYIRGQITCSVCLSEFQESVKIIPNCKHLFHVECIDTWFKLHITCPVCRGTKFFDEMRKGSTCGDRNGGGGGVVVQDRDKEGGGDRGYSSGQNHGISMIENGDTCVDIRSPEFKEK